MVSRIRRIFFYIMGGVKTGRDNAIAFVIKKKKTTANQTNERLRNYFHHGVSFNQGAFKKKNWTFSTRDTFVALPIFFTHCGHQYGSGRPSEHKTLLEPERNVFAIAICGGSPVISVSSGETWKFSTLNSLSKKKIHAQ